MLESADELATWRRLEERLAPHGVVFKGPQSARKKHQKLKDMLWKLKFKFSRQLTSNGRLMGDHNSFTTIHWDLGLGYIAPHNRLDFLKYIASLLDVSCTHGGVLIFSEQVQLKFTVDENNKICENPVTPADNKGYLLPSTSEILDLIGNTSLVLV